MKQTGEKLRKFREQKGVDLQEVAQATKIKMSTLRAIEEGDLKQLPSKTFIRGFVQSYVRYLNADEEEILNTFHTEMGSTVDIPKHNDEHRLDDKMDANAMKFANSNRHPLIKVFVGVGAIVLLALIYFVSSTIDKYQEEKQLVKPTQEEAVNLIPISEEEDVAASEPRDTDSLETVNVEAVKPTPVEVKKPVKIEAIEKPVVETPPEVKKPEPVKLVAPKKPEPKPERVEAVEKPKPVTKPEVTLETKVPKTEEVVIPKKLVAKFVPQEVIIEALDKVEIEFRTDGGTWVDLELQPEQIHTIKGKNEIDLRVNDGGAVNIIYNGKERGVPGTLGSKAEVSFPR